MNKLKFGTVREDGKIFIQYDYRCKNPERWVTPRQFKKLQKQRLKIRNKIESAPGFKEKANAYQKERRRKNPEAARAYMRDYIKKYRAAQKIKNNEKQNIL